MHDATASPQTEEDPVSPPILVAFSPEHADRAPVHFAVAASRFTGAPLVVVAVGPGAAAGDGLGDGEFAGDPGAAHEPLASELRSTGVDATIRVVEHSSPARGVFQVTDEIQPGLIVIGSTHRGKLGRVLLGSTAERLMQGSPSPVVVVPHGHEQHQHGVRTVGAGFTPTPEGQEALRTAALLARSAGARLEAIMVLDSEHAAEQSPGLLAGEHHDRSAAEDIAARHRLGAEDALRGAIAEVAADLDVEPDVLFQESADGLVAASERLDLLVLGSRAYGPVGAVTLGGVGRKVTAAASCPVLVLPRGTEGQIDALVAGSEAHAAG
jgi:nucleotide-binding universal stress UspA family protein